MNLGSIAVGFGVGAALFVAGGCAGEGDYSSAAVERYRAAGMPWTIKDIEPGEKISEKDNAAPLLQQAYAAWKNGGGPDEVPLYTMALHPSRVEGALKGLAGVDEALNLAVEASRRSGYDPGWDSDIDFGSPVPEMVSLRRLIRGLCQRSEARVVSGRKTEGLEDWAAALNLTMLARSLPDSMAAVHASTFSLAVSRTSLKLVQAAPKDLDLLLKVEQGLTLLDRAPDWKKTIKFDAYPYLAVMRNCKNQADAEQILAKTVSPQDPWRKRVIREGGPLSKELEPPFGAVLSFYTKLGETIKAKDPSLEEVIDLADELEEKASGGPGSRGPSSLSRILRRIGSAIGHARAALAAVSLKKLELTSGEPSVSLTKLAKNVSTDPLTEMPLGFARGKGRFKVWSVGSDFNNDGGQTREDVAAAATAGMPLRANFDESAEFPQPVMPPREQQAPDNPLISAPTAENPRGRPSARREGAMARPVLKPGFTGVGPLSIRRDASLGNGF